jgi:S1/P1 Nuclease
MVRTKVITMVRWICKTIAPLSAAAAVGSTVWAWGCTGHQIVALIAEHHLNPHARAMVMQILAASPISPDLRRYCGDSGLGAFVDASTWADDERGVRRDTADWHFIDIPRGARPRTTPRSTARLRPVASPRPSPTRLRSCAIPAPVLSREPRPCDT